MSELSTGDVYNLAAEGFDLPQMGFVARANHRLVEMADLHPGQAVLDIGCGTGSSALLAAQRVAGAESGHVLGVDVAERMVERARQKAAEQGIGNVSFAVADLMNWTPPATYDVVLGAFALFHLPDPPAALEKISAWTRRPGRWGFTFWGEGYLQEFKQLLRFDVASVVPGYTAPPARMERYNTPEKIQALLAGPGRNVRIVTEVISWQLAGVEDWWTIAWNSGERRTIEAVSPCQREALRQRHLDHLRSRHPDAFTVDFNVHTAMVDV